MGTSVYATESSVSSVQATPTTPDLALQNQPVGLELLASPVTPSIRSALTALYGPDFPLLKDTPTRRDWAKWAENRWMAHGGAMQPRLFIIERNRLFRRGIQWISSTGTGPWREPAMPRDAVRAVENVIAPALDQRVQVIAEQRPGFRTRPATSDPDDLRRAEAQQNALEYQYDAQNMEAILREAAYWAGTDGVSFLEIYWDPDAGPWHELPSDPDNPESVVTVSPIGDVRTRVRRMEQIRVSSEATATVRPRYVIVRETIPMAYAVDLYGAAVANEEAVYQNSSQTILPMSGLFKHGLEQPALNQLYRDQKLAERTTVYIEPNEYLPKGATVVAVGNQAPLVSELLAGVIPIVRFTDGSTDPAFYPAAIMEQWIDSQMRINAVKSRWIESVRFNAGGKLIAREGAVVRETLTTGQSTIVEVRDPRPFNDLIQPFPMMSVGNDAKELLDRERKQFEDLSGWNPISRGEFSADQSGKAILAIREQLERIFAPPVNAAARAMTEWGKINLAFMRWGYSMPRELAVQGVGRPDLARLISSDDMTGAMDVFIDPETMMPMPRSLRLFLLNDMVQRQLISPQEYRRHLPFASVKNMATPDEDQEARARRVVEAIRQSGNPMALPILWQDNEAIHQDVLERDLILRDDTDPMVRQAASLRWNFLAQQAQMKAMGMMMPPPGMQPQFGPPQQGQPLLPPGNQAPTMALNANGPLPTNPEAAGSSVAQEIGRFGDNTPMRQFDQFAARPS